MLWCSKLIGLVGYCWFIQTCDFSENLKEKKINDHFFNLCKNEDKIGEGFERPWYEEWYEVPPFKLDPPPIWAFSNSEHQGLPFQHLSITYHLLKQT